MILDSQGSFFSSPPQTGPLDPRDVPALMAGAIYQPGVGVTSIGGGSSNWASQSDNSGPDYDLQNSGSGNKPVATTSANGAAIWDLAAGGPTANWCINGPDGGPAYLPRPPGPALQFTERGSYAVWLKANELDTDVHVIFSMWPEGGSGNRLYFCKNNDEHRLAWFISRDGSAVDDATDPGHRSKGNTGSAPGEGVLIDWTDWRFIRFAWNLARANYSIDSGNFSDKVEVFVDEVRIAGGAANNAGSGAGSYSAPTYGAAPPDGPVREIATDAGQFSPGSAAGIAQWNGQMAQVYVSNEDTATPMTLSQWARVRAHNPPVTLT